MSLSKQKIQHIVIVGGGAAGWLTANHLACALRDKNKQSNSVAPVTITLVESPNIPTVGVGEGTVPSIRDTLHYFGISETDLMQQCAATFKQSIEFTGWQPNSDCGKTHSYQHVFDYPNINHETAFTDWVQRGYQQASFADTFSIQAHLIKKGLAPKKFTQAEFQGVCNYAYHFDAGKFGQLLANNAVSKLGVIHKQAEIQHIVGDPQGGISHLMTDTGEVLKADLFIDCSGARSLLLGDFLQVPFISKNDMLFTDTALATQVQYQDPQQAVACSTLATAHSAGWIWDIGLTGRRGVGIVYSSKHMSEQDAAAELSHYIGDENANTFASPLRKIPMNSGYHEKFWQGNCVAIGMSQGFVEPLEATGLLMFDKSAQLLSELVSTHCSETTDNSDNLVELEQSFNRQLRIVWDGVFDFIKLHYCISKRSDSQFWRDHQDRNTWSANLRKKLDKWAHTIPSQVDFADTPGVFNLANHLYVLFGMQVTPSIVPTKDNQQDQASSHYHLKMMEQVSTQIEPVLLQHRALLQQIQRYGLHRI